MADVVEVPHTSASAGYAAAAPSAPAADKSEIVFHGSPRNMVVGTTLLLAGASAFLMGMTDVFFAEAVAYVFIIWGALFLLNDLLDWTRSWSVSDEGVRIGINIGFWKPRTQWEWANINRLDLVVKRYEPKPQDVVMQVYYTAPGDPVLAREDRIFSPELAEIIIKRAGLKPTHAVNPAVLDALPPDKTTYIWNKSGKFNAAM